MICKENEKGELEEVTGLKGAWLYCKDKVSHFRDIVVGSTLPVKRDSITVKRQIAMIIGTPSNMLDMLGDLKIPQMLLIAAGTVLHGLVLIPFMLIAALWSLILLPFGRTVLVMERTSQAIDEWRKQMTEHEEAQMELPLATEETPKSE